MTERDPHWLESETFEVAPGPDRRRRWPRWWPVLPLGLVALLVVILVVQKPTEPLAETPAPTSATASSSPSLSSARSPTTRTSSRSVTSSSTRSSTPAAVTTTRSVTTSRAARNLWGVTGGWEVFTIGSQGVVRIQPAAGLVTRTLTPGRSSNGSGMLFPLTGSALVLQPNGGDGYQVPDGKPATALPAIFSVQGADAYVGVFPGADPSRVWVQHTEYTAAASRSKLTLLTAAGKVERTVELPAGAQAIGADGRGGMLAGGLAGGVYRMEGNGFQQISSGMVLGIGPRTVLLVECDEKLSCATVAMDLLTGARRPVPGRMDALPWGTVISPDGELAATVVQQEDGALPLISLLDLVTGRTTRLAGPVYGNTAQSMAFSPDGSLLLVVGESYRLQVFDRAGKQIPLGLDLPPVEGVAVRPG